MKTIGAKQTKIFFLLFFLVFLSSPFLANAQIVPCGGPGQEPCGYQHLIVLVNRIINWIIMISMPIAAGAFAYAGILYMTTGVSDKKSEAKTMIRKVFIGFICILSAWIIVTTITNALLKQEFKDVVPVEGV
jgi:hypothetical protein